jgi:hypothetical protein
MLLNPVYRRDYIGEIINDNRDNKSQKIMVKPRNVYFKENLKGKAIVIGNGVSRCSDKFKLMMKANSKRPMPGYKITYGCNGAIWDLACDYYVINNRLLMGYMPDKNILNQLFLPDHIFLEHKKAHMIPYLSGLDAGTLAAFLACFDGNDEVYLFGFDGRSNAGNNNIYAGKPCYDPVDTVIKDNSFQSNLYKLVRCYKDVKFYRVGGGETLDHLVTLPNFKEVSYNAVPLIGDF